MQFCYYCSRPMLTINIARHCEKTHDNVAKALGPHDKPQGPVFVNWSEVVHNLNTVRPIWTPPLNDNRILADISVANDDNVSQQLPKFKPDEMFKKQDVPDIISEKQRPKSPMSGVPRSIFMPLK